MAWKPTYVDAADLAEYLSATSTTAAHVRAVEAASRIVDRYARRQFGSAVQVRKCTARRDTALCRWVIDVEDISTSVGLTVEYDDAGDGTFTTDITDYTLAPVNASLEGKPYTQILVNPTSTAAVGAGLHRVRVTATFGWAAVPIEVEEATLIQAAALMSTKDAAFGSGGQGDMQFTRGKHRINPEAELMLKNVRRVWGAA